MAEQSRPRWRALATRWLGLGLAVAVSIVTLSLGVAGQLTLYISPESIWFACAGAVVVLAGAIWSCTLPLGAEADHGHDHGHGDEADADAAASPRRTLRVAGVVSAGVIASGVVIAGLVLPPASLSVELAMSRADATGTLFAGSDTPTLGVADTTTFGVGEWSSVFATATRPEAYDGSTVTLTGFVTPGEDADAVNLTRMIITHCVIDAQPAAVPVSVDAGENGEGQYSTGQWIEVTGTVTADGDGSLRVVPSSVVAIDEPGDPYEY
ncbi:TIGR03943 family protein [Microbacterium sp.]|uniref:TIGR03943 family putative permease subunit n=1 Tax=Microbacterium sp. TaxID=51671 RepID=UPI0027365EC8|nr:TIGR03943 family protein [Microbacterium sp.]MDP3950109.1 TIGR03943 family protein [Microbacterium sp.]